jgi:hypothetical protein
LPEETLYWYTGKLKNLGYNLQTLDRTQTEPDGTCRHQSTYIQLRPYIYIYINNNIQPILSELPRPVDKAYKYYNTRNGPLACLFQENRDVFIHDSRDIDIIEAPLLFPTEEGLFEGLEDKNLDQ